jgi:hypothetical protein
VISNKRQHPPVWDLLFPNFACAVRRVSSLAVSEFFTSNLADRASLGTNP